MTESEWLACADPEPMLKFLEGRASARKRRLFAAACVRRVWRLLRDRLSCNAVEVGERFVDGLADERDIEGARKMDWRPHGRERGVFYAAITAADYIAWGRWNGSADDAVYAIRYAAEAEGWTAPAPRKGQSSLLREVFGNPFRPVALDPAWRTPTVVSLATAAYEDRILPSGTLDRQRLAILADALEDAGCTNADILDHCRGPGPHVRGCWVIDLLLGKT
jgi:hypothetical protein